MARRRTFEPGFPKLFMSPFPQLSARGEVRAREVLAAAMTEYVREGGWKEASSLTRARVGLCLERGLSLEDIGRAEASGTFAVLSNSTPCVWWLVFHILSDERVLADVRHEVSSLVVEGEDGTCTVDLAHVRTACPVLLSTLHETMRYRGVAVSARAVLEDSAGRGLPTQEGQHAHDADQDPAQLRSRLGRGRGRVPPPALRPRGEPHEAEQDRVARVGRRLRPVSRAALCHHRDARPHGVDGPPIRSQACLGLG